MKKEIEAKFLDVNHEDIRERLKEAGATLVTPMRLMKRAVFDLPGERWRDGFVRVRDEGDKITFTYKEFKSLSVDGAREIEVEVDNFDDTVAIVEKMGIVAKSYQESKRETWSIDGAAIELDEWPWLKPYIEVEASSKQEVQRISEQLDFKWKDAVFGDIMVAYRGEYPHLNESQTVGSIKEVVFGDPLPDLLKP